MFVGLALSHEHLVLVVFLQYAGRNLLYAGFTPKDHSLCLTVCLHFHSRADYRTGLGMLFLLILLVFLLF